MAVRLSIYIYEWTSGRRGDSASRTCVCVFRRALFTASCVMRKKEPREKGTKGDRNQEDI